MSIAIKDIPEETWNKLIEDYKDELTAMSSIEEDELNSMIYASIKQQDKLNNEKVDTEIIKIVTSSDEHLITQLSLWWSEGNTLCNAKNLKDFKKFRYNQDIKALEALYHFETSGWDNSLRCIIFRRTVNHSETHEVVIEDHRDDEHINDWLIFSYLKDNLRNWYGQKEDEQYPLELREYRTFANLINLLEDLYPLEKDEHSILYI